MHSAQPSVGPQESEMRASTFAPTAKVSPPLSFRSGPAPARPGVRAFPAAGLRSRYVPIVGLALTALMLSFLVIWRSQVAAPLDCRPTRLTLNFNTQADAAMTVASGMPCALLVDTGPASIDTLAVDAAPANGYLNPRGRTGVVYRSMPWFKGEDDFTVALKGRVGSKHGVMQVHVRVVVQ